MFWGDLMHYKPVFSALNRAVSGMDTSGKVQGLLALRKIIEAHILTHFNADVEVYVLAVRHLPNGVHWELYEMKQSSRLLSIRGRLEHRTRRKRRNNPFGFHHVAVLVKQNADGHYELSFKSLTEYMWESRHVEFRPEVLCELMPAQLKQRFA